MHDKKALSRSEMMSRIGPRNTKPEIVIRRGLHAAGFRFRLHRRDLPGTPDVVLPKHRVVIFINGCFWHRHESCGHFKLPKTNTDFWEQKISGNVARDRAAIEELRKDGWRVLVVWECETRKAALQQLIDEIASWITGNNNEGEIPAPASSR